MTQEQYTTKGRTFQHLTREKRAQIEILLQQGLPKVQITKAVGISRSTLYNELKRGTVEQINTNLKKYQQYFWDAGQRAYEAHRQNSRPPMKLIYAYDFVCYAEKQILENKLSPDAICGEAKLGGKFQVLVCTKTLYSYIDQCLLKVRNIDLPLKVRRKQHTNRDNRNNRILGTSIEERPDEINNRTTFGNWEIDTIVGKKESSPVLLSLDERFTRKRHLVKIPSRSSEAVRQGLEKIAEYYGNALKPCSNPSQVTTAANLLTWAGTCPSQQRCTMLILIPLMREEPTKSKTRLFGVSSQKANHLIRLPMNKSLLLNIGSTIYRVKSSITAALLLFFKVSYLILQFRFKK